MSENVSSAHAANAAVMALLTEIRDDVRAIRTALGNRPASATGSASPVDDADPEVMFRDPPLWKGARSYVGMRYSQCPAEYLDTLASFLEWRAAKEDGEGKVTSNGKSKAEYSRRDAALAKKWAARIRSGDAPQPPPVPDVRDDDIPF